MSPMIAISAARLSDDHFDSKNLGYQKYMRSALPCDSALEFSSCDSRSECDASTCSTGHSPTNELYYSG